MKNDSFWLNLKKPIIGLSPMDGVTDAAFRFVVDTYSHPSILYTEFVSAEGLSRGALRLLYGFIHHKSSTPIVAQIFGAEPKSFSSASAIAASMGFDGIDINMGCPDKNVARHGGGAALILDPKRAKSIINETKQGLMDWADGKDLKDFSISEEIIGFIASYQKKYSITPQRRVLPVSVKTRIGYDRVVTEEWISQLLETAPSAIAIHGRTLKQMYSGCADWNEIEKAARLIKNTTTLCLGNGDIHSLVDAQEKVTKYNLDGVLIGRASLGNPWIFSGKTPTLKEKLQIAKVHAHAFVKFTPQLHFLSLRKHLLWYCRGFAEASTLRARLATVESLDDIDVAIDSYLSHI
jgi:tRNA-dihydrouridine synthase